MIRNYNVTFFGALFVEIFKFIDSLDDRHNVNKLQAEISN